MNMLQNDSYKKIKAFIVPFLFVIIAQAQTTKATDATAPLHASKPDYPVPYSIPSQTEVTTVLNRLYQYLDTVTPTQLVNKKTGLAFTGSQPDSNIILRTGDFRLTSYEWGVTYSGMLAAAKATGDKKFYAYAKQRCSFLAQMAPAFRTSFEAAPKSPNGLKQVVNPEALDDAGAVCAAMIKLSREDGSVDLRPLINRYIDFIANKQFRLADKTLARNRPQKNTLWLDDLYMGVPALAQMGKLTGDKKYFDDAVKQVLQFSKRMFNNELNVYMHGWVEGMAVHPEFHWARANGWAIMAMTELLDVLPQNHEGRAAVLLQLQKHIKGIVAYQSGQGFWHQLLDRNDSYLETSATAIYTYCLARAINNGWIDAKAYAPACLLAWNAVTTKVNGKGQVEGTCVGTGMAFDPAFYYYRPTNVYAAHGYGPVLLAGAEIINLLKNFSFEINDSAIQLKEKNQ
jgi:unsaturated rhamnogalacturonyl hydrolase